MKYTHRLVLVIIAVTMLAGGLLVVQNSSVSAAPSKTICHETYNGKAYPTGINKKEYNKSGCDKDDGGTCSVVANKSGRGPAQVVQCQAPDDIEDDTLSVPVQTDPALNFGDGSCADASNCDVSCNDAENCNLITKYVNPFIIFLSASVGLAVVIGIIWGAILYSTSAGDPQKVAQAKDKIRNALIALIAFIFLFAFLQWLLPGGL